MKVNNDDKAFKFEGNIYIFGGLCGQSRLEQGSVVYKDISGAMGSAGDNIIGAVARFEARQTE